MCEAKNMPPRGTHPVPMSLRFLPFSRSLFQTRASIYIFLIDRKSVSVSRARRKRLSLVMRDVTLGNYKTIVSGGSAATVKCHT